MPWRCWHCKISHWQLITRRTQIRNKVVYESQHYCIIDGLLYYLFQRRWSASPMNLSACSFTRPSDKRTLRTPWQPRGWCISWHRQSTFPHHAKILLAKDESDIRDCVRSFNRCQTAKRDFHPFKPPMTAMPRRENMSLCKYTFLGPLNKLLKAMNTYSFV